MDIAIAEQQHTIRLTAVTARPAGFLIVCLNALGHVVVDNIAHIGFVDTHAEGVGGNHHRLPVIEEILLILAALLLRQACVIAGGGESVVLEQFADTLHLLPGGAINNAAFPLPSGHEPQEFIVLLLRFQNLEEEVGPVETRHLPDRVLQLQNPLHILPDLLGGGGGIGTDHRPFGQAVNKIQDPQITGPEILAPLGNAVGLVHRDKGYGDPLCYRTESAVIQSLGSHIHDFILPRQQIPVHRLHLGRIQGAVDIGSGNAGGFQRHDLIPHQGNQGRDHQGNTRQHQGGNLIAHALTAAGGHDTEDITARQNAVDQGLLTGSEAGIAENPLQ